MNNDNTQSEGAAAPPRTLDLDRTVYEVEVIYHVKAKLWVLAHDRSEAVVLAEQLDLDDLIGFDEAQVWIDADTRLEFDDVVPELSGLAEPANGRDPREHPDWYPEVTK